MNSLPVSWIDIEVSFVIRKTAESAEVTDTLKDSTASRLSSGIATMFTQLTPTDELNVSERFTLT